VHVLLALLALLGNPPPPDQPIPRDPAVLAGTLTSTTRDLRAEIDAWGGAGATPEPVTLLALYQQRMYRLIARKRALGNAVLARLPEDVAAEARDTVRGRRELLAIPASGTLRPKIRAAEPESADRLRAYYDRAQQRFGVGWHVLAAVNFVETGFGRMRNESTAGARGPMQFMPATWHAYGLGGDIRDPRDAVLGAANYLHANGAPRSYRRALFHYNPSPHYVEAVLRFARRIRRDERAFYSYYAWQVYVRGRRITGP
jgi:membrane-bound lytic murein transglycosylase B